MTHPDDTMECNQDVRTFPPTPPAHADVFGRPARPVPTAAIVVGVLMILGALFALSLTILTVALLANGDSPYRHPVGAWGYVLGVNILAVVLQFTMGIGLCTLSRWARKGAIASIISLFVLYTFAVVVAISASSAVPSEGSSDITFSEMFIMGSIFAGVLLAIVFTNAAMAYSLTRPQTVAAFEDQQP